MLAVHIPNALRLFGEKATYMMKLGFLMLTLISSINMRNYKCQSRRIIFPHIELENPVKIDLID